MSVQWRDALRTDEITFTQFSAQSENTPHPQSSTRYPYPTNDNSASLKHSSFSTHQNILISHNRERSLETQRCAQRRITQRRIAKLQIPDEYPNAIT